MYVNYCIWLEVIWWSWISAEHQVEGFLLTNHRAGSHFSRLLPDETCSLLSSTGPLMCTAALMSLTSLYQQRAAQDFGVCVNKSRVVSPSR